MQKINKQKNQHGTSLKKKNNYAISSHKKKQQNHEQNQLYEQKIKVQASRREKSKCKRLHEQKSSRNKFYKRKNQHVTNFTIIIIITVNDQEKILELRVLRADLAESEIRISGRKLRKQN